VLVVVGPTPQYRIELSQNLGERLVRVLLGHGPNLRLDRGKRLLRRVGIDEPLCCLAGCPAGCGSRDYADLTGPIAAADKEFPCEVGITRRSA
jgi:hypothetical protein